MIPVNFKQANKTFVAPKGLDDSQVMPIPTYHGTIERGCVEGSPVIVTAWLPSPDEIQAMIEGRPIYISFLASGLPPHFPTVRFVDAVSPGVNLIPWKCPVCFFQNTIQQQAPVISAKKANCEKCDAEIEVRFPPPFPPATV